MRRALCATALCSCSLMGASCAARPLYTHFLFFPKRHFHSEPKQIDGVPKQNVEINVKDGSLHGWYFERAKAPYVVLVNHGNGGNVSSVMWIARNLLSSGVSVLLYDYRGYGRSKGDPTVQTICDDGDAAYSFLISKGYKPENIILYGQSLGCAVACHISTQHEVAGLILQSGFSSLRNVAYQRFPFLQRTPNLVPDALDNAAILSQSNLPVLLIHGDRDKVVPFQNAEDLYRSACGEKWLVVCPNSGHRLYPESDSLHRSAVHRYIGHMIDELKEKAEAKASQPTVAAEKETGNTVASITLLSR